MLNIWERTYTILCSHKLMGQIILLKDVLDLKKRKEKELAYYQECLDKLLIEMNYVRHEIALTETILTLIKKDKITEIE